VIYATPNWAVALLYTLYIFSLSGCTPKEDKGSETIRAVQRENEYSDNIRLKAIGEEIAADPANPIPWAKRADLYLKQGDFALAIADAKQALQLDSTRPDAYVLLASAYRANRRLDSAAYCIYKAKVKGYVSPTLYVISGEILLIARRYVDASKELDEAIRLAPDNSKAYFYKGLVQEEQGDTNKAIANFNKAVSIDPEFADGHNKLAIAFMRRGELDFARQHLQSGLRFSPNDAFVNFNMGIYFQRKNKPDSAKAYFAKAVFFEPSMYLANFQLGMYSYRQKNYLEAANRLEAALQYAPTLVDARFYLALSREFLGSYPEALEQYKQVLRLKQGFASDSKAGIARIEAKMNKLQKQEVEDALSDTTL
jgi:tetratricopeptide (TPR) repeat protein